MLTITNHMHYKVTSLLLFLCSTISFAENQNPIVIPFHYNQNGQIMLEAAINGYKGKFGFDTGTFYTWAQIGTQGLPSTKCNCIECNDNDLCCCKSRHTLYALDCVQFGDEIVKAHSLLITDSIFSQLLGENSGIMGYGVFGGYWLELSFSKNVIILHKEKPIHFTNAAHSPLLMPDGYYTPFYLTVNVNGINWLMAVDTGLPFAFYFPNDISSHIEPNNIIGQVISNGEVKSYDLIRTNTLTVLDITYTGRLILNKSYVTNRFNGTSHTDVGLIGLNFLKNYDLLIDLRNILHGKTTGMYYIPIVPPIYRDYDYTFRTEVSKTGIISYHHYGWCIMISDIISNNIPGLQPNSVITRIDERKIIDINADDLIYFLENAKSITILVDKVEMLLNLP